jgi:tetratricopeptide (TPR) repeat protein
LEQASQVAVSRRYYRIAYETLFDLATIYRDEGRLADAQERLEDAIDASRKVRDGYYLPKNLEALAELKAQTGELNQAHALYEQAEDVVDGMLANTPGPYTESSLLSSMSSIYLGDFTLAARVGDATTAFRIIERARGRTAADMLRNHSVRRQETPAEHKLEDQIATLQLQLMRLGEPRARTKLLDRLLEAEERLRYDDELLRPALHLLSAERIPLVKFQRILRPNESLLEYVLAEPHAFCLAATRDNAAVFELPAGGRQIETLASQYLAEIDDNKRAAVTRSNPLFAAYYPNS